MRRYSFVTVLALNLPLWEERIDAAKALETREVVGHLLLLGGRLLLMRLLGLDVPLIALGLIGGRAGFLFLAISIAVPVSGAAVRILKVG